MSFKEVKQHIETLASSDKIDTNKALKNTDIKYIKNDYGTDIAIIQLFGCTLSIPKDNIHKHDSDILEIMEKYAYDTSDPTEKYKLKTNSFHAIQIKSSDISKYKKYVDGIGQTKIRTRSGYGGIEVSHETIKYPYINVNGIEKQIPMHGWIVFYPDGSKDVFTNTQFNELFCKM